MASTFRGVEALTSCGGDVTGYLLLAVFYVACEECTGSDVDTDGAVYRHK